jgi:hypothetical protein
VSGTGGEAGPRTISRIAPRSDARSIHAENHVLRFKLSVVTRGCAGDVHLFAAVGLIRKRASMTRGPAIESRCDGHTLAVVEGYER